MIPNLRTKRKGKKNKMQNPWTGARLSAECLLPAAAQGFHLPANLADAKLNLSMSMVSTVNGLALFHPPRV